MDKLIRGGKQVEAVSFQGKPLGTPRGILEAANNMIGITPAVFGITIDKEVKNPDGTTTFYFTSNAQLVPRVAQHDIDTCCGTTANNVQNLAYVNMLEARCKMMDSILAAHNVDTLYQLMRYIGKLESRCQVLTEQVKQLKKPNDPEDYSNIAGNFY